MIIVQTPLRISLFGGGTDFRSYFLTEGGCVVSSAIDKYIYITIKKRFDEKLRVGYTRTEMVDHISEIQHELIREALSKTGIISGVEVASMGDIPSTGSGLGSSGTVTVGALHAMYSYLGELVTAERLAQEACEIEIDVLNKPVGVQDQYIVSYGGFRLIEFGTDGLVTSRAIKLCEREKRTLDENLMLFYTGLTRKSSSVLNEQKENINHKKAILGEMKHIAYTAYDELQKGKIDCIGELLHESWKLKKGLASKISNHTIDEMYQAARRAGAVGGKVTGAGGGGFLLLYCPHEKQNSVRNALSKFQELPFQLELDGSKVILNYRR
jgi:D-glycero-alpha-D-manno-heptose-7-phosphate kinase